ncbi:MAG: hypothetical protein BGO77_05560 [Caedibacter sp. 37-49]|nr:MAG: hypothetical protein BGO77_05560 [Caedibacter sp. 37-49]
MLFFILQNRLSIISHDQESAEQRKKTVYFNKDKNRLCIFFYPAVVDNKPGEELHYIKIKRAVKIFAAEKEAQL